MSTHLVVACLLALLPISEVRGAIPYVMVSAGGTPLAFLGVVISVLCNMLVPLIAYTLLDLLDALMKSRLAPRFVRRLYSWLLDLGRKRALSIRKESYIALTLFVGVPLPATGAWTGSLVAYVLGLERRKAVFAIELGVLIASIIVFVVAYFGIEVLSTLFLE
ncbi:MAG: small multi-drug export protein [Desulfurococcaceae archaeon]